MTSSGFSNHFASVASAYAANRPGYPPQLFEWLAGLCATRDLAWDCATGSGQAAAGLAPWFKRVVATDASAEQIARSRPAAGVGFQVATAERSGLADRCADLITVAQALHWFDLPSFYAEARRVARAPAVIAAWTYGRLDMTAPRTNAIVEQIYQSVLGPYWPAERKHPETGYRDLPFPFERIPAPRFEMKTTWSIDDLAGYMASWSAAARYTAATGRDAIADARSALADAWRSDAPEHDDDRRCVRWPLTVLAGRIAS
ncbi:MAG: class I SAM-dependent methyltransferase [Hyphomicrobiaceae bacterium]